MNHRAKPMRAEIPPLTGQDAARSPDKKWTVRQAEVPR